MTVFELIRELEKNKVIPQLAGEQLKLIGETESLPAELLNKIKSRKNEILEFLNELNNQRREEDIITVPPREYYELSNAQKRIWILSQFEGGSAAYNITSAFYLKGKINAIHLNEALKAVIRKHESLRTVFRIVNGEPRQFVKDAITFQIDEKSLEHTGNKKQALNEEIRIANNWQFDFEKGPLLKVELIKLDTDAYALIFGIHHIISDGWSSGILVQEVMSYYTSCCKGEKTSQGNLQLQYKDYTYWFIKKLEGEYGQKAHDYWLDQLEEFPGPLQLPADFPRADIKGFNGNTVKFYFSSEEYLGMQDFCKHQQVTFFSFLQTVLNLLLYKYSGQDVFTIGTPVSGRTHSDLEDQIGLYVNTLVLKTRINSSLTLGEYLQSTSKATTESFKYQDYPFDKLVEDLNVPRDLSRSPLFDVMIVLQNTAYGSGTINITKQHGFELYPVTAYIGEGTDNGISAKFDLSFNFSNESKEKLCLEIEYSTELFKRERIEKLAYHFKKICSAVMHHVHSPIKDLDILSAEEKNMLLKSADKSDVGYDRQATILSLFKKVVVEQPDAVALEYGNKTMTYKELDERAGKLARILVEEYEIKTEDPVILHFERSEWMIIGILAVLKAGAAYVPVDPAYPTSRIDFIINDVKGAIGLCDVIPREEIICKWNVFNFLDVTKLDLDDRTPFEQNVSASNLAYVIYTSGTTGNPKGVLIEHGNVTRLLFYNADLFDFNKDDRWLLFHSYCFDVSVWEMYGALLNGGTLLIASKDTLQDRMEFYKFFKEKRISVLCQTPTAFRMLIQQNKQFFEQRHIPTRYIILAGEALMPVWLKEWHDTFPSCKIINMYGITETTVYSTYKEITEKEIAANKSNIGSSMPTCSMYVLDRDMQLTPSGVTGEIYIGGSGVGRGYLGRPELTAERFIQSPFKTGERLYRSGDFATVLPNGDIEYFGRRDDQIKVRGHRVELREIEVALNKYKFVKDSVVLPIKNVQNEYELVAYFISEEEEVLLKKLRAFLSTKLPAYMIPSYLIQLSTFPLTSNGKLDRKALPRPGGISMIQNAYVAPRNNTDELLVKIWQNVLKKDKIGIQDNFFELGGHSLKATRVISEIYEAIEVRVDLKNLFALPTIEHLSNYIQVIEGINEDTNENVQELTL